MRQKRKSFSTALDECAKNLGFERGASETLALCFCGTRAETGRKRGETQREAKTKKREHLKEVNGAFHRLEFKKRQEIGRTE